MSRVSLSSHLSRIKGINSTFCVTTINYICGIFFCVCVRKLNKWWVLVNTAVACICVFSFKINQIWHSDWFKPLSLKGWPFLLLYILYLELRCMNLDSMPGANINNLRYRIRELESESCTDLKIPVECCWIRYRVLKFQCNLLYRLWALGLKPVQRNNFLSVQSAIWLLQSTVPLLGLMHIETHKHET